jgi:hypothetical protein
LPRRQVADAAAGERAPRRLCVDVATIVVRDESLAAIGFIAADRAVKPASGSKGE